MKEKQLAVVRAANVLGWGAVGILIMVLGTSVAQATVTAVGTDTTTGPNWRTAAALETDNQYGTDGYVIYGIDASYNPATFANPYLFDKDLTVLPAVINDITTTAVQLYRGENFGTMENPANGNAIVYAPLMVLLGATSNSYTISRDANASFRLTVLVANDGTTRTYTTTVNDGSGPVQQSAAHTTVGLHYHVYDISPGISDVEVAVSAGNHFSLTGLAFDNVIRPVLPLADGTVIGIDLGTVTSANWNNFSANGTIGSGSVVNLSGEALDAVTITASAAGYVGGAGNPSWAECPAGSLPDVPDSATSDFAYHAGVPISITISNLSPSVMFDIDAVTSADAAIVRSYSFTATGAEVYTAPTISLADARNNGLYHSLTKVRPTAGGVLTLQVSESVAGNPICNMIRLEAEAVPPAGTLFIIK